MQNPLNFTRFYWTCSENFDDSQLFRNAIMQILATVMKSNTKNLFFIICREMFEMLASSQQR